MKKSFFFWPLTFFWSAEVILQMVAFHLVLQLIPHTRVVPKLPKWIEGWLNTPSHHRLITVFIMLVITWSTSPLSYIEKFTLSCLLWLPARTGPVF